MSRAYRWDTQGACPERARDAGTHSHGSSSERSSPVRHRQRVRVQDTLPGFASIAASGRGQVAPHAPTDRPLRTGSARLRGLATPSAGAHVWLDRARVAPRRRPERRCSAHLFSPGCWPGAARSSCAFGEPLLIGSAGTQGLRSPLALPWSWAMCCARPASSLATRMGPSWSVSGRQRFAARLARGGVLGCVGMRWSLVTMCGGTGILSLFA